ncbi:MAG: DUF4440 domain-containing protein [Planctomycetota bacterium]|jgi:hypothetical protein
MMTIRLTALACATLVGCASRADEADAIRKTVFDAQRAGHVRHDLEAYMAQFTEDAQIVGGRSEKPHQYDLALNRKKIEATRRLRFRGRTWVTKLEFDDARVEIAGGEAVLRVHTTVEVAGTTETSHVEEVQEIYRLRRTPDGWKVFLNRWWPAKMEFPGERVVYDVKTWQALDADVEQAKRDGDPQALASAFFWAFRFAEAHAAAGKLTGRPDAEASDWALRGQAALFAGDAADATRSFATARSLNPEVALPSYAAEGPTGE